MTTPAKVSMWADRDFRRFCIGDSLAQLCVQLGQVALPVIAVALLHASEQQVGILGASGMAAFLLVGLPAGAWIDRLRKRHVMIRADVVRFVAALAVPVLWMLDALQMWHLYVISAVIGVATVFFDVAYQSFIPALVDRELIGTANSRLESTAQIARTAGPAVGGLLLKVISAPLLVLADALGYLLSVLFLRGVHDHEVLEAPQQPTRLRADIGEGIAFVRRHSLIRPITMCTGIANFSMTIIGILSPILVLRIVGAGPEWIGIIMAVGAVGGLLGASYAGRLAAAVGEGRVIVLAAAVGAVMAAAQPLAGLLASRPAALAVLVAGQFLQMAAILVYNVTQVSMRQAVCPPRLLGRMNASIRFVVWGVMPISALVAGWLGGWIGVLPTLWIGVGLGLLAAVPVALSPLTGMKELPKVPEG